MARKKYVVRRNGVEIEVDDDGIMQQDGESLRVPIMLMDNMQRSIATHLADSTPDAQRDRLLSAYEARDARTANAWRDPAPVARVEDRQPPSGDSIAAYERRDQRLRDAWRHSA